MSLKRPSSFVGGTGYDVVMWKEYQFLFLFFQCLLCIIPDGLSNTKKVA